jgi:Heterokaryon incompatibility protein (HET)
MSSFDYASMPIEPAKHEIRLLDIQPCSGDSENIAPHSHTFTPIDKRPCPRIQCSMRRVCLDDGPKFTALSYTWGDPDLEDRGLILLDDVEVSVTPNLESALLHLRQASATTTLWVDALCINQSDNGEKSEAVQQMKRVYQDATHVIVWLGPSGDDSDVALQIMNEIGKEACDIAFLDIPRETLLDATSSDSGQLATLYKFVEERMSIRPSGAIARLTHRLWWSRVWVLQELVLARDVTFTCGFSTISFSRFAAAIILYSLNRLALVDSVQPEDLAHPIKGPQLRRILALATKQRPGAMVGARRKYHGDPDSRRTLIQLLRASTSVSSALDSLEAKDCRDKIFGMLGLASDADQLGIRPDYSTPCQTVYTDAARTLLQHGHTDILVFSQFPKMHSDLPEWVPDWTSTIQEPCGGCIADACFSASGKRVVCCPTVSISLDAFRLIALNGCRVDTLAEVGKPWLPTIVGYAHDWPQSAIFVSEIESFCGKSDLLACPIYESAQKRKEAVWRIPCGDMDRLGPLGRARARSSGPDVLEGFKLLKAAFESKQFDLLRDPRIGSYTTCMGDMFKRRPFVSEQGYVGLAPSHAEVGDVIVIIYGAIVPFIVRDLGNGQCQFIGETYVHGIMDGEYIEKNPPTETFILC